MKLSIVIPACNEEARLGRMLERYLLFFDERYADDYEILVVVNGSKDRTEDVVAQYARTHCHVKVLVDARPIGKGGAVMLGFARAQGRLTGFVDADGATPPEAFNDLVKNIGAADAIIASRWMPGSRVSVRQPLKRRLASRLFNALVRLMFGLRISDTQCGAKLLKREVARAILPHIGITQWAFDVDLLFQLRRAGFVVAETPTTWQDISGSRLRLGKASLDMFVALVRLRLIYSPFRWVVALYDKTLARYVQENP